MARLPRISFLEKILLRVGIPLAYALTRALGLTLRRRHAGCHADFPRRVGLGERFVFAFWHGDSCLITLEGIDLMARHGDIHLMVSPSRDGELMARFVTLAGARVVRGSSSRRSGQALLEMVKLMGDRDFGALAVDAPRGPRHVAKSGVLLLARRRGLAVQPVAARAPRKWVVGSWDGMEFPHPFSSPTILYGEPLHVPADADPAGIGGHNRMALR